MPLLKGKRTSKIRPEFVIFDPQMETGPSAIVRIGSNNGSASSRSTTNTSGGGAGTERSESSGGSDFEEGLLRSPRTPRRKKTKTRKKNQTSGVASSSERTQDEAADDDLSYLDTLPENVKLVQVTSNIWGTKFKIHGLAKTVPSNLGQVSYKTSLLHLQPRQMTLVITELRDDFVAAPDPNFNPHVFSEDEEEQLRSPLTTRRHRNDSKPLASVTSASPGSAPLIAPMSPRPTRFNNKLKSTFTSAGATGSTALEANLARAESYEDEAVSDSNEDQRPSTAPAALSVVSKPGPSYASLVTQYSRSTSSSGQPRHAISPLCCEGSVPTLQSPKNAVAPVDIIFDRPPANQSSGAGLMVFHSSDYTQPSRSEKPHDKPAPAQSKRKDLQFIDEESTLIASGSAVNSQPPAIVPGDAIPRSCSVGYLDSVVQLVPSDSALSMLRRDAPHKRLILVDKRPQKKKSGAELKLKSVCRLHKSGKSKSLELFDLSKVDAQQISRAQITLGLSRQPTMSTVVSKDSDNGDTGASVGKRLNGMFMSKTPLLHRKERPKACASCKTISPTVNSSQALCTHCRAAQSTIEVDSSTREPASSSSSPHPPRRYDLKSLFDMARGSPKKNAKRRTEVIKSYADSPLFNRKHRFQNQEPRSKRRSSTDSDNDVQAAASASVQQSNGRSALTSTLDSLMGRGRFSSNSTQNSPAAVRKDKRHVTSSPIRQILNSPLLGRRNRKNKQLIESSDDEPQGSGEESSAEQVSGGSSATPRQYRDLETFQKAQLRQKVGGWHCQIITQI